MEIRIGTLRSEQSDLYKLSVKFHKWINVAAGPWDSLAALNRMLCRVQYGSKEVVRENYSENYVLFFFSIANMYNGMLFIPRHGFSLYPRITVDLVTFEDIPVAFDPNIAMNNMRQEEWRAFL